jgi:hypothetical protein
VVRAPLVRVTGPGPLGGVYDRRSGVGQQSAIVGSQLARRLRRHRRQYHGHRRRRGPLAEAVPVTQHEGAGGDGQELHGGVLVGRRPGGR